MLSFFQTSIIYSRTPVSVVLSRWYHQIMEQHINFLPSPKAKKGTFKLTHPPLTFCAVSSPQQCWCQNHRGSKKGRKSEAMPTFLSCTLAYRQATVTLVNSEEEKEHSYKMSFAYKDGGKIQYSQFCHCDFGLESTAGSGSDSKDGFVCVCTYPGRHPSVQRGGARARSYRSECCGVSLVSQQTGSSPPFSGCSRTDPDACRPTGRRLKQSSKQLSNNLVYFTIRLCLLLLLLLRNLRMDDLNLNNSRNLYSGEVSTL